MQTPTTLKDTAEAMAMTQASITEYFHSVGHIRRDPMTDEWRVTRDGVVAGTVVERTKAYRHPVVGWKECTQIRITGEGRRWLRDHRNAAA